MIRRLWRLFGTLFTAAIVGACGSGAVPSVETFPETQAVYFGLAVLAGGQVVAEMDAGSSETLSVLDAQSNVFVPINLQVDQRCWRESWFSPTALPDGRLGLVHVCQHAVGNQPPDEEGIYAVDASNGSAQELFRIGPLGSFKGVTFTVGPSFDRVIYDINGFLCDKIAVADHNSADQRLRATVSGDGHEFTLDEPSDLQNCDGTPRAGFPALSPNGRSLAFFASPASIGVGPGPARLEIPWNLYVLDLQSQNATIVAEGLSSVSPAVWSRDANHLLYGAVSGGQAALWEVSLSDKTVKSVSQDDVLYYAYSADGHKIVGIRHVDVDVGDLTVQNFSGELVEIPGRS